MHIRGLVAAGADAPARGAPFAAFARTARRAGPMARHLSGRDAVAAARGDRERWRRLDVAAGLPQVYARTSEEFIAQMLNLDALGAIAFEKGCYTGQEVIARAHYRGRVKRRMQRFVSHAPCQRSRPGMPAVLPMADHSRLSMRCDWRRAPANFWPWPQLPCAMRRKRELEAALIEASSLPLPYELPE